MRSQSTIDYNRSLIAAAAQSAEAELREFFNIDSHAESLRSFVEEPGVQALPWRKVPEAIFFDLLGGGDPGAVGTILTTYLHSGEFNQPFWNETVAPTHRITSVGFRLVSLLRLGRLIDERGRGPKLAAVVWFVASPDFADWVVPKFEALGWRPTIWYRRALEKGLRGFKSGRQKRQLHTRAS